MYTAGNIIYFDPFFFKNGSLPKPKYFLVLSTLDQHTILASLPSSKNHLPSDLPIVHGCINMPESCISCYIFQKQFPITEKEWAFPETTFLYGNWIDEFPLAILKETYKVEGLEYELIGTMKTDEFLKVKECFKNSATVKRKFKRIL